ncbi:FG-GAP repeat domain-containing protein [Hymenobacter cellulosilyticus]|uniref:VCBS repeat-containing protein n=1 Tax=Hymenobacter cellulosilyticus TaxID=2932248 RepID=A0A8T9QJJ9_9BACT|nr:VCBS repeat-containing protein [Hymenobacter cellulosilyticus]UOQ74953.1 VCBS repeat-containing protein [Hymenobacter cellulosilyticus]
MDGDGDLDLLSGGSVRLNNGAGVFTAPAANAEIAGLGSGLSALAVGDLDGDGALDLVAPGSFNVTGKIEFRFNNGAGVFTARAAVPSLAVANDPGP